jgi:hypothetical protein
MSRSMLEIHVRAECQCPFCRDLNMQHWTCSMDMDLGMQHGHAFPFLFASYHIRFAIFASDHIRFASIRFISYSFRMPNFRICFETNRSESNPLIRYFANIYSLPDSLYSLRSEYEGTPYVHTVPYCGVTPNSWGNTEQKSNFFKT